LPFELLATAAFGLEAVVVRELEALGYAARIPQPGKVAFEGDALAIARANLWLRSAERVVLVVARFEASDFGQLFDGVAAADWAALLPADAAFPVRGRSHKSQLSSVPACQKIVKKAVVDKLLASHGVEQLPESGPQYGIDVALLDNRATITLDTTGAGLHKRGYRPAYGAAPLRETLAAGMLQLSYWRPGRPMLDPFCGAGTIAIEAAMLGRKIAPGLKRSFAAEDWPTLPAEAWQAAREEAHEAILPPLEERIQATDSDGELLKLARRAADLAGVTEDIHFQQRDFADTSSKREYGCLFANPPYGMRLGEEREAEQLHRSFPEVLRRLPTWSHYVLTARLDFETLAGQKADRRRKLYNGRIECTLFQYQGPKPGQSPTSTAGELDQTPRSATPQPAFGGLKPEAQRQGEEFANRLRKLARHLRRWPTKRGVTCFRLYDRDIPDVPLAVDRYESEAQVVALHIAEYERPHDRTPAEHADWLDHLATVAAKTLEVSRNQVFLKRRARQRGADQYQKLGEQSDTMVVREADLQFKVNLSDYLDTGLFLDHRTTRGMVGGESAGKRVLNLFAYTGSFTVYAAAGGAAETTTVDLSPTYLDWARENMRLNGFLPTGQGIDPHQFAQADSREYVASLPDGPLFDLAVVDPPTFSNSKRTGLDWDVQEHAAPLLAEVAARLSSGGVIYFSTNSRRFKLDESHLAGLTIREISNRTVPEDFRNKRIHRCWRMVKS